jgi:hypothetical protein
MKKPSKRYTCYGMCYCDCTCLDFECCQSSVSKQFYKPNKCNSNWTRICAKQAWFLIVLSWKFYRHVPNRGGWTP